MSKYYNVSKLNDEVHIVIGEYGYGKKYHEENKKLLRLREQYVREIQGFDFINGNNKSEEPRYYMDKGAIEVLDYLLRIRGIFK